MCTQNNIVQAGLDPIAVLFRLRSPVQLLGTQPLPWMEGWSAQVSCVMGNWEDEDLSRGRKISGPQAAS